MHRWLVPEVVQTSAMDCGPATLKSLLEGFGVAASYGRLREACSTSLDGTSIDQIEDVANRFGLDAEQVMLPVDHVFVDESAALPALLVMVTPGGATHFVVAWGRRGSWVQLMDPATGRRWQTVSDVLTHTYVHSQPVPAEDWRRWAASPDFLKPLEGRLRQLGLGADDRRRLVARAIEDASPCRLAALDAAVRFVESLAAERAIDRSASSRAVIDQLLQSTGMIPDMWWSARLHPSDRNQVVMRGAVLLRVRGIRASAERERASLSQDFARALTDRAPTPLSALRQTLRAAGALFQLSAAIGVALAAASIVGEAMLLRAAIDITRWLAVGSQRWEAIGAAAVFLGMITLLDRTVGDRAYQIGRGFEGSLRLAFLTKVPRLGDAYFRSRLLSDMAERAHSMHRLRELPRLLAAIVRIGCALVFTVAGIAWLYPGSGAMALVAALVAIAVPLAARPWLEERDLRARSHAGALSRFFVDALLGLTAIRAHGAARAVEFEHEQLLAEWGRAARTAGRSAAWVQSLQAFATLFAVIVLLFRRFAIHGDLGGLLLVYWALSIPTLGQELATLACQYPRLRNTLLRVTEPLGAAGEAVEEDEDNLGADHAMATTATTGVAITMDHVSVSAGGHVVLADLNIRIAPGEHVAIVGTSGAGKSSLAGLVLGWHRSTTGEVAVDGRAIDSAALARLRRSTAWISPEVHLWNRSLLENIQYSATDDATAMAEVLDMAALIPLVETLPDGLQTPLGESGRRLSGGEGQRVRFGRGLHRSQVRLVVLDEAFRGLECARRLRFLAVARRRWAHATLLNITHDIEQTLAFDRVLVMDGGRIVEDGSPQELSRARSRYRELLDAAKSVSDNVWSAAEWRAMRLDDGRLQSGTGIDRRQVALC
jgi:ABC-type bacteriocin/lantibiotic exporter with double-glycine peptidase domain